MPRTDDQYKVRLPLGMRDKLCAIAAESGRSMNAEIIHRLLSTMGADAQVSAAVDNPSGLAEDIKALREMAELLLLSKGIDYAKR